MLNQKPALNQAIIVASHSRPSGEWKQPRPSGCLAAHRPRPTVSIAQKKLSVPITIINLLFPKILPRCAMVMHDDRRRHVNYFPTKAFGEAQLQIGGFV